MKKYIICLFIALSIIFVACDKIDVSKLSDKDLQRISKELIVCNKPYIRFASECCLDKNDNSICDKDEGEKITKETPSGITPPIKETPTSSEQTQEFQDKCTLQSGISCIDHKATATSLSVMVKNSLGYDITVDSVVAQQCTALGSQGTLSNGGLVTYTLNCVNGGSKYNGNVNISYTNIDTQVTHVNQGQVTTRIE